MLNRIKLSYSIFKYNLMLKRAYNQTTRNVILRFIDMENKRLTHWKTN